MVVFPGGDANVIASAPGMRGRPDPHLYVRQPDRRLPFTLSTSQDSAAPTTRFVCGFLGCDSRPFNPLLQSLPRIVHASVSDESRQWVADLLEAAVHPGQGAGREAMLAKLAELMFVEALRNHLVDLPEDERGWLAALRDPQVGAALRLLHGRPADPWTLDRLAAQVNVSRSSLAQRFTHFVGVPPMHYLARWRIQLAARTLEAGSATVAQVAGAVGYQSEAAFTRAFKREVGVAPGAWRRGAAALRPGEPTQTPGPDEPWL